jgi:hypothetical protein
MRQSEIACNLHEGGMNIPDIAANMGKTTRAISSLIAYERKKRGLPALSHIAAEKEGWPFARIPFPGADKYNQKRAAWKESVNRNEWESV